MSPWIEDLRKTTTTKNDLAVHLTELLGLTHREAGEMVEAFFSIVTAALKQGKTVKLAQFGTFRAREKASRPGRNLHTSELVEVSARRSVNFVSGPTLKQRMSKLDQAINPRSIIQSKRKKSSQEALKHPSGNLRENSAFQETAPPVSALANVHT